MERSYVAVVEKMLVSVLPRQEPTIPHGEKATNSTTDTYVVRSGHMEI